MTSSSAQPPVVCVPPRVFCVIVNWNGWQDTLVCLASLRAQDYPHLQVLVVDNGSTDGSVQRIGDAHPWVTLHETGKNLGFARGCNAGTRLAYQCGADLVWLLNNDTGAPPNTLSLLVRTALAHPEAGAIGSVLLYMRAPEKVQAWGGGTINLLTAYTAPFTAPASFTPANTFLTGASLLLPRRTLEQVGLFYEGFFMYCDDSDLCLRIHRAGLPLVVCAETAILHKEGGSSPKRSPLIDQFATTSTLRLLERAAPIPLLSMVAYLALRLGNRLLRGRFANATAVAKGIAVFVTERHRVFTDRL